MNDREVRYLEGIALWRERNLSAAVEVLAGVLAEGSPDSGDGWWHSASRALAQIALETDVPEAEWHLRKLQGTGVGNAQTLALRARRWFQDRDEEPALAEVHMAVNQLATDSSDDLGSLMNGAIALAWCAEVLAELGYGDDASALATRARARMVSADVDDGVLDAMLTMVEASVSRLIGDPDAALGALDRVDTSLSPDLAIQVTRERARLAGATQRAELAAELYERSLELARELGYAFLERSISDELTTGPPLLRTDRAPIDQWDPRAMENVPQEHRPYAVVIRLPLTSEAAVLDLEGRISQMLRDDPDLGLVDGTGTDGRIWELFLDGDDPDALWDAVRPLLGSPITWPYVEVTKRSGSGTIRFRLGDSP